MNLSSIFHDINEEYIDIPSIKKFCNKNKINMHGKNNKGDLIKIVENYADDSLEEKEKVLSWIDNIVKAGIKEIQIKYCELPLKMQLTFSSEDSISKYLNNYLTKGLDRHLCGNKYKADNYQFVKYEYENSTYGPHITMYFCKRVLYVNQKTSVISTRKIDYPIIAEYYLEKSWIFIRYKSRVGIYYDDDPNGYTINSKKINMNNELKSINEILEKIFSFDNWDQKSNSIAIKQKIYCILKKFTKTPKEISDIIKKNDNQINNIIDILYYTCHSNYLDMMKEDVHNLVEKYLSISWPGGSDISNEDNIFIKDREAYPVKLSAMDEEDSHIDQSSSRPLQSTAMFFDNKRMLKTQRSCESILFKWKRKDSEYYNPTFPVKISEENGICKFKFSTFTAEEDIENVLFSIIEA